MTSSNRVVLNTAFLYIKMFINIFVGLLTTRWILVALGVEDFGIYNLVAGVISMLSFLNAAMAGSTQRYISYYMGQGNSGAVEKVFYYSIVIHAIIALCVLTIVEIGGWYLIQYVLDIPIAKAQTAMVVLHILAIGCCFTVISVPYEAIIVSHENMLILSIFSVIENLLKAGTAILLLYIFSHKLIVYALLMLGIIIIAWGMRRTYCRKRYTEAIYTVRRLQDKTLLASMTGFAGWNLIGGVCSITRGQGMAMVINIFYGVVVNAAYGIANQVNGLLSYFSVAMMQSLRPQIVKSEGMGDRTRVNRLTLIACKYMFFLSAVLAIPLLLEMPYVLSLWLKEVPEYTVQFCRLIIIQTLLLSLSSGLYTAVEAVGRIKWMQLIVGTLHIVNLPISYFLLKSGYPVYSALICVCAEEAVCGILRLFIAHNITGVKRADFVRKVLLRTLPIFVFTYLLGYLFMNNMSPAFFRLVVVSFATCSLFLIQCWIYGFEAEDRNRFVFLAYSILSRCKIIKPQSIQ